MIFVFYFCNSFNSFIIVSEINVARRKVMKREKGREGEYFSRRTL